MTKTKKLTAHIKLNNKVSVMQYHKKPLMKKWGETENDKEEINMFCHWCKKAYYTENKSIPLILTKCAKNDSKSK